MTENIMLLVLFISGITVSAILLHKTNKMRYFWLLMALGITSITIGMIG